MLMDSAIYKQDVEAILASDSINWNEFKNKRFLITGGTGLIGTLLVNSLLSASAAFELDLTINLVVRSKEKALNLFDSRTNNVNLIETSVEQFKKFDGELDYVIHAASQTSSKGFVDTPVETFKTTILGTMNLLEIAKRCNAQRFIFLSTMEVYGTPTDDKKITEDMKLPVLTSNVRNCYPISKIASENLCCDYANEYGISVSVLRLTQTFGPGVKYDDARVFAEFARCVIENRDIILKTKGETKRSYLYTVDAVTAILTVLQKQTTNSEIYNVANEETYCSIYDMAQMVAHEGAHDKISVRIKEEDNSKYGYAQTLHMNLSTNRITDIGWHCTLSLDTMYKNTIEYMKM